MKFSTLVLAGFCVLAYGSPAWAHIELLAPTPRVPDTDDIKATPCGPGARNPSRVSTFQPGETITIEVQETISHPGYFRVLMDEAGQNDLPKPSMQSFERHHAYYRPNNANPGTLPAVVEGPVKEGNTWVLTDYWGQHPSGAARKWMLKVKLPNVTCDTCTLQLVQSMFEPSRNYNNAYYYHCADLIIKGDPVGNADAGTQAPMDAGVPREDASAGGAGGQSGGGGEAGGAGSEGGEGGEGGASGNEGGSSGEADDDDATNEDDATEPRTSKGGCAFAADPSPTFAALGLLALAAVFVRRKAR